MLNSWIQSKDLTFTRVHVQKPSTCVHTRESVWFGSTWGNHWTASPRDFRCCKHSRSRWVRASSSSESDPHSFLQYFNYCSGRITSMFAIITTATIKPTIMPFIQLNRQHWIWLSDTQLKISSQTLSFILVWTLFSIRERYLHKSVLFSYQRRLWRERKSTFLTAGQIWKLSPILRAHILCIVKSELQCWLTMNENQNHTGDIWDCFNHFAALKGVMFCRAVVCSI